MTSLPGFAVRIDQKPCLPLGGRDVSAVVTVTADVTDERPPQPDGADGSAEIIIVDCSGSKKVSAEDEMALDTRSVKTVRVGMDAWEAPGSVRNDGF